MNDYAFISIIVPVYQTVKYIKHCIESISNQVYSNIETILVDDGSKDESGIICDEYVCADSHFIVIHQGNAGQSCARNHGLKLAKGDYLSFVDSDDHIASYMFSKMMENIRDSNAEILNCGILRQVDDGEIVSKFDYFPTNESDSDNGMRYLLTGRIPVVPWNKLFRKMVFNSVYFPEGISYEDEYIMPYLFSRAQKIAYINIPLYFYNERLGSTIHSSFGKTDMDRLTAQRNHIIEFSNRFPDLALQLKQRYYMACADVFGKALIYNTPEEIKRNIYKQMKSYLNEILPELHRGNWLEASIANSGYSFYTAYRKLRMKFSNNGKSK